MDRDQEDEAVREHGGAIRGGIYRRVYEASVKFLKHHKWSVIILAVLALVVEEASRHYIIEAVIRASKRQPPKIVLAVFPDTPTARPMADGLGFDQKRTSIKLKDGWRLEYMAESGTAEATNLALQKRLEDENVVLVVGHDNSSTVKYLLNNVYRDTGIPLILPAVTNPDLTTVLQKGPTHILRLPPTDDVQVSTLRSLMASLAPTPSSVVLMVDNSNVTYSNFIATQLIETGRAIPFVDSVGVGLGDQGFKPELFLSSHPDVLVFIGMEVQADIFLRRLKHEVAGRQPEVGGRPQAPQYLRVPTLVFTDGVAGELFDEAAKGLLETNARIFLTCPLPPFGERGQMVGKGQMLPQFPTYKSYAVAARAIIDELIERVGEGKGDRAAIIDEMSKLMHTNSQSDEFGGIKVKFDEHGDNTKGAVHIYEIKKGGVVHSELCSCT